MIGTNTSAILQRVVMAAILHHSVPADQLGAMFVGCSRDPCIPALSPDVVGAEFDDADSPGLKAACCAASQAARR